MRLNRSRLRRRRQTIVQWLKKQEQNTIRCFISHTHLGVTVSGNSSRRHGDNFLPILFFARTCSQTGSSVQLNICEWRSAPGMSQDGSSFTHGLEKCCEEFCFAFFFLMCCKDKSFIENFGAQVWSQPILLFFPEHVTKIFQNKQSHLCLCLTVWEWFPHYRWNSFTK